MTELKKFGNLDLYKPSQLAQRKGTVIVIAGRGGDGKTSMIPSLFESDRVSTVLVGDARGRTHVLPDLEGLYIRPLRNYTDFHNFNQTLLNHPKDFDAVVIDTFSEVQGQDLKHRGLYDAEDKMRLKIYGDSHMDMTDKTRVLYDLAAEHGIHIVLFLWIKPGKDENDNDIVKLMLTDQFGEYFRGIVDYIGLVRLGDPPNPYPPVLSFVPTAGGPQKLSPPHDIRDVVAKIPRTIYRPSLGSLIDTFCGDPFPVEKHGRIAK